MMLKSTNLGFPRIGRRRELKRTLESYWSGQIDRAELERQSADLRAQRWQAQSASGLSEIPSNDFSLYDHVLDTALMVGAVPGRFGWDGDAPGPDLMFAMARGGVVQGREVHPLDMTKWYDTNYHYLVPELDAQQGFRLSWNKPLEEFSEAAAQGLITRPVLLGPVTFLQLSRCSGQSPLALLDRLLPCYAEVLASLAAAGASWVQLDEPCLSADASVAVLEALDRSYAELRRAAPGLKLLVASYFAGIGANLPAALALPVDCVHLDLVRGRSDLAQALESAPDELCLSLGVVDGRGVWQLDPDYALPILRAAATKLGPERVTVAPSCSLMHIPVTAKAEVRLDPELRSWLAFAEEKLDEVVLLAQALDDGAVAEQLQELRQLAAARRASARVVDPKVRERAARVGAADLLRPGDGATRRRAFRERRGLPSLPTTSIGSFPQTSDLRQARARRGRGELDAAGYQELVEREVERVIRFQEDAGFDVLVHGEPERNDMVEYFAEQLNGFLTTQSGWVQSYGSRCTKPPIIFGDVSRRGPMTVRWAKFAQGLTPRPVKGILTGPVTILEWSFPREDLDRSDSCLQIALALRDEVADLEAAGIEVIQIDEPALREGMPLHKSQQPAYLRWAVDCFRLAAAGAGADTQVHTHMCYSEFGEIMDAIAALEADALYIEAARSDMELLQSLSDHGYPAEVGPGLYDIHSPAVPGTGEMAARLRAAARVLPPDRLWANPDCGLKTRRWEEVEPSLRHLVEAAREVARELEPIGSSTS